MTKSTITREESVQAVFDLKVGYSLGLADIEILKRVARMALAELQAEPVTTACKLPFEQWLLQQTGTIDVECGCVMTEVFFHWLRVAYEAGNSPVIPDGYVMVPKEPTKEMIDAWWLHFIGTKNPSSKGTYKSMLAAAPQDTPALDSVQSVVTVSDTWIPVSEGLPEEGGRYWCYVEEQNSLGKSHYQWNCSWNGEIWGGAMMYGRVTHWMPLPNPPREEK